jgi:hypothetical protein
MANVAELISEYCDAEQKHQHRFPLKTKCAQLESLVSSAAYMEMEWRRQCWAQPDALRDMNHRDSFEEDWK